MLVLVLLGLGEHFLRTGAGRTEVLRGAYYECTSRRFGTRIAHARFLFFGARFLPHVRAYPGLQASSEFVCFFHSFSLLTN
jgi:hypothetical protein